MEINEKILKNIIKKAIEEYLLENEELLKIQKKNIYIILGKVWNEKYRIFFQKNNLIETYNVFTVFQKESSNEFETLKKSKKLGEILYADEIDFETLKNYKTIFPVVSQEVLVKTALCIDDIFETKWIKNCFRKGSEIQMLISGFEIFTGKEPEEYIKKMKEYYKTILKYNIKIKDINLKNEKIKECFLKEEMKKIYINPNNPKNRKIITYEDIANNNSKDIIINKGDIITEAAKDLALKLNLKIIRNF